jgi:two-component system sensor histidine kinase PilS (NtrC family)
VRDAVSTRPRAALAGETIGKIQWLMFFRVVMITVLLGSTLIVNLDDTSLITDPDTLALLGLIVGTYLLTIVYAVLLRRVRRLDIFTYAQLFGDVATVLALVSLTGGTESVFLFMFSLTVLNASILLYRRGALVLATVCAVMLVFVVGRELMGVGPGHHPATGAAARGLVLTGMANVLAMFLVALLAGYLSEQLRDTDQRLRFAREDIEQLRALNEHIITSIQSGLVSFTLDGRVIFCNPAAERIIGLDAEQVLYRRVTEVFPALASVAAGEARPAERWEGLYTRPDGSQRILGFSLSPLVDSDGVQRGSILIFQDLSPIREMEEAIRRSERFAAIGKMAAGIAHEIRNPLASISGSIQMLQRGADPKSADRPLMDIVVREVDRLNDLISDFLNFARPRALDVRETSLAALLGEVVEIFRYLRHRSDGGPVHDVHVAVQGDLRVDGDPQQLKQVFWNLLNNAVEAMPDGGAIEVSGRPAQGPDGPVVEVEVTDEGLGIPEENMPRIFDPFFTTKERGTGLGLSLVLRIVEDHQGTLRVDTEPGRGTTFQVTLPARPRRSAALPVLPLQRLLEEERPRTEP